MAQFAPMPPVNTPQPELAFGDLFGSLDSLVVPDFSAVMSSLDMDLPLDTTYGAPTSPTNQLQHLAAVPQMMSPVKPVVAPPPVSPAELRLENESEIQRLLSGAQPLKSEPTPIAPTTSTRSGRAVRNRNACIERVIDPEQEEDEVDLEVALSYGSRQGIALDKPNKRRRRGDDPLAAESHRLEKNRQSARECRLRKKAYIRGLETQSRRLSDKVKQQDEEIASLRANLKAVYDKYQALAAKALSA
eukprot:m.217530 g.217530  ORF g.217530 m.217530 type:complete len:246 (+) comp10787_c0_seq6:461-1198(+)